MKNSLRNYIISWVVLVALFNVVCFVTPDLVLGYYKYGGSFWSGYWFITGTFVAHLIYAIFALSEKKQIRKKNNSSVFVLSIIELIIMIAAGTYCMLKPFLPNWVGIIICSGVLAVSILLLVITTETNEAKIKGGQKLRNKTERYNELTNLAQLSVLQAPTEEAKAIANKVYEAMKYSDAASNDATAGVEIEIESLMNELTNAFNSDDKNKYEIVSKEILGLIAKRSVICSDNKENRI